MDLSKSNGPDGIPARLLKKCCQEIAPSLCALFNLSLQTGRIASEWKSADVTPAHKRNSKKPAENYRPISLLPIVSKVLERCVFSHFYHHVTRLINPAQHGFICNRSCVTQLLSVLHPIGQNLDNNTQTDVLYLDLAKAFDSVDHTILLEKLRGYGVTGPVQCWCAGYLNDRTQRVVVDGVTSSCSSVTSGVPQGSILGPLLFVLFDLHVKNEPFLYADDTKLHQIINSLHDCQSLQRSLTNLDNWSNENELCFNAAKCEVLTITRKKTPIMFDYTLGDEKLTRVFSERSWCVNIRYTLLGTARQYHHLEGK